MTITPQRGASGTTRSARNRSRRRAAGSNEPGYAASAVEELSPPRRRAAQRRPGGTGTAPAHEAPAWDRPPVADPGADDPDWPPPLPEPLSPEELGLTPLGATAPAIGAPVTGAPAIGAPAIGPLVFGPPVEAELMFEAESAVGSGLPVESGPAFAPGPAVGSRPAAEGTGGGRTADGPALEAGLLAEPAPAPGVAAAVRGEPAGSTGDTAGSPQRRRWRRGSRRAPVRRSFLGAALVRCLLYLGPLSAAVAAAEPLGRVAWPVPAVVMLLGWAAAQALTSAGVTVAGRSGPSAAVRLVGSGFAAVTGLWCALVWIAPDHLLGPDRALAATVGVCGLLTLGSVTAALVTRAEAAVAGWFVPCWLLAAAAAGFWTTPMPAEILLPAAIVAAAVRAFAPAAVLTRRGRTPRLGPADRQRAVAHLVIGAAQAACVTLLWQAGPSGSPLPAVLPLLVSVPLLEALIGWHTRRIDAGLDSAETPAELDRHVRNVTTITIAGMVPPLAAGGGLAVAAYQLPYDLVTAPGARADVLALAAGLLLGGVFAVTFLLAARSRAAVAATLAAVPPLAAVVIALVSPADGRLPAAVAVLAAAHVAGLLIVALTAAEPRRTP